MDTNKKNKENIPNIRINEKYTNGRDDFDIYSIFGKEYLEEIQRVISDVTGIAFVTIDYKGEPLTEMTNFSKRCSCIRKNPMHRKICELSDASGAIIAAVSKKTSIYFCPFNLLEVAIPIIINDKYLGAFIGGQVICKDAPEKVLRMHDQLMLDEIDLENIDVNSKEYTFREFESIVKLVELIISEIIKKELVSSYHENKNKNKIKALEEKINKLEKTNLDLNRKLDSINNSLNKLFLNNMMESLSNLALIEEAEKTREYSEHLRNFIINSIDANSDSVKCISKILTEYFKMKEIQYGDRFKYEINIDEGISDQKTSFKILITYVVAMCYLGLNLNEDEYYIKVNFNKNENKFITIIEDNGFGISKKAFDKLKSNYGVSFDIENIFNYVRKMEEDIKKISNENTEISIDESNKKTVIFLKYNVGN